MLDTTGEAGGRGGQGLAPTSCSVGWKGGGSPFSCDLQRSPRTCCMAGTSRWSPTALRTRGWVSGIGHCSDLHCQQWKCLAPVCRGARYKLREPELLLHSLPRTSQFQAVGNTLPLQLHVPITLESLSSMSQRQSLSLTPPLASNRAASSHYPPSAQPPRVPSPPRHWGFHHWKFVRFI